MAKLDDDNTVGFYSEQIAVTTTNGFESGKSYCIRITGVVGGVTGIEVHQFDVSAALLDDIEAQTDLDEVVEGTLTMRQMLRLMASFMVGKASGGGSATIRFRDTTDAKTRITMEVDPETGDRITVTLDGS